MKTILEAKTAPASRLRWVMIALAFFATAIIYLDRQTLSIVAPILIDLYHMSNETYSRIVFAFMFAYTIMNGLSGPLIDRLGTRRGYAWTTAWWSASAALHALTNGPWSLGVFRFMLGMGEAGNWPAAVKLVAEWFPVRERALASGIFNSGSTIGAILAPPAIVWVVLKFGWRSAFLGVGACGFIWLAIWLLTYYTPVSLQKEVTRERLSARHLFTTRFVWGFILSKIFLDPVWYFYIFWFPAYLKRARDFSLLSIGKYAWIPYLAAGAGNILGGVIAGALLRRGLRLSLARRLTVTIFACLMTMTVPAVLVSDARLSIALVSVAMLGYTGVTANMLAMPADIFPSTVLASIWGYSGLGSGLGGMVFALATGWLVDRYSYVPVFFGFGLMPLIALFIIWTLLGPLDPIRPKLEPQTTT
jgi:MFS transporter, ACS family, hexuronate transporter